MNGEQCEPASSEVRPAIEERLQTCPNGYLVLGSSCQAYTDHAQGYTGHSHDLDTGLIYMQARYYDPSIGRFLAPDPVGFSETNLTSFNRYAYANNNPYKYVDPDGKSPFDAFRATLSFALADAAIPEPTDVAAPAKAVGYASALIGTGIVGLAMVGYEALHNEEAVSDTSSNVTGGAAAAPDVPKGLVGVTDEKSKRTKSRQLSGPLSPEHGGTGNAQEDFDKLTGGQSRPAPEDKNYPPGTLIGDNDITLRPGPDGPRIDIPGNGDKPPETLHY